MASLATMEEQQAAAEAAGRQPLPPDALAPWGWVPLEKRVSIAGLAPAGPRPGSGGGSRPSSAGSMAAGVSAIDQGDHIFLSPGGSMAAGSASLLAHPARAILHRSQFA